MGVFSSSGKRSEDIDRYTSVKEPAVIYGVERSLGWLDWLHWEHIVMLNRG